MMIFTKKNEEFLCPHLLHANSFNKSSISKIMLSTKKGSCLLKIYQPKRNPTPHLPPKSPQNSTHKNIIKIKKWNIHSNKQIKQKLYGNYLLKKLYKLTWNILYIKQKQLCCKDSVKTFFFNLTSQISRRTCKLHLLTREFSIWNARAFEEVI